MKVGIIQSKGLLPFAGLILLGFGGCAHAGWVRIDQSSSVDGKPEIVVFVDKESIQYGKYTSKMWGVYDLEKPIIRNGRKGGSIRFFSEYDCFDPKVRVVSMAIFDGRLAQGDVIYYHNNTQPGSPIPPGSLNESMWLAACENFPDP